MSKVIIFLADGMSDEPISELGGRTPLEAVDTPFMDSIAEAGASGTFLSLPEGFPTSSDVANMSVLGYDPVKYYPGRGPLEAASQDIELDENDIAWRCNLIYAGDGVLLDYSAGHIDNSRSEKLMEFLQNEFGNEKLTFHHGVGYRNLLILHGNEFSEKINYHKPDSSQGKKLENLKLSVAEHTGKAIHTVEFLHDLMERAAPLLSSHPLNKGVEHPANYIWPWSPGKKTALLPFSQKYGGKKAAVISAVDVILGIAKCTGMDVIHVPGATGFIDTNYKGKAEAAIAAIEDHDFVYLHIEAIDECSHIGDLKMKMLAISDFDSKIVGTVMSALKGKDVTFAVLPDHAVPVRLQEHTRTPVPVAVCGKHIKQDSVLKYSEKLAPLGSLGWLSGDALMKLLFNQK